MAILCLAVATARPQFFLGHQRPHRPGGFGGFQPGYSQPGFGFNPCNLNFYSEI